MIRIEGVPLVAFKFLARLKSKRPSWSSRKTRRRARARQGGAFEKCAVARHGRQGSAPVFAKQKEKPR
jgi:hypothetical protein